MVRLRSGGDRGSRTGGAEHVEPEVESWNVDGLHLEEGWLGRRRSVEGVLEDGTVD